MHIRQWRTGKLHSSLKSPSPKEQSKLSVPGNNAFNSTPQNVSGLQSAPIERGSSYLASSQQVASSGRSFVKGERLVPDKQPPQEQKRKELEKKQKWWHFPKRKRKLEPDFAIANLQHYPFIKLSSAETNLEELESLQHISALGEGTFSKVIAAKSATGKVFALKYKKPTSSDSTEKYRNNLEQEVKAIQILGSSPHIVSNLAIIFNPKVGPMLISEYVGIDGWQFANKLRRTHHTLADKWLMIRSGMFDITSGLQWLAQNNMIHRDIKLLNTGVDKNTGDFKLFDFVGWIFGWQQHLPNNTHTTRGFNCTGSDYMQLGYTHPVSDVFSLGKTAEEFASLVTSLYQTNGPFPGQHRDFNDFVQQTTHPNPWLRTSAHALLSPHTTPITQIDPYYGPIIAYQPSPVHPFLHTNNRAQIKRMVGNIAKGMEPNLD